MKSKRPGRPPKTVVNDVFFPWWRKPFTAVARTNNTLQEVGISISNQQSREAFNQKKYKRFSTRYNPNMFKKGLYSSRTTSYRQMRKWWQWNGLNSIGLMIMWLLTTLHSRWRMSWIILQKQPMTSLKQINGTFCNGHVNHLTSIQLSMHFNCKTKPPNEQAQTMESCSKGLANITKEKKASHLFGFQT